MGDLFTRLLGVIQRILTDFQTALYTLGQFTKVRIPRLNRCSLLEAGRRFCCWIVSALLTRSEHHRNFDDHVFLSPDGFALS